MIKGDEDATADALSQALLDVRRTYGVAPGSKTSAPESKSVLVVAFPPGTSAEEISRKIHEQLG